MKFNYWLPILWIGIYAVYKLYNANYFDLGFLVILVFTLWLSKKIRENLA